MAVLVLSVIVVGFPGVSTAGQGSRRAPSGGIGIRLIDAPASARNDPRARLYIVDHLPPGAVIRRRIEVSNTTASRKQVILYPAAASIVKGTFIGAEGNTPNEVSSWTSVAPGEVNLSARGRAVATVTITVPADASPGERYGVVWAEARSPTPGGGGVTRVNRVGIRIYLSVGPGGAPAPDFTVDSVTAKRFPDGRPAVLATVRNTGGRALDMSGTLELTGGPGGLSAGPFPANLGTSLAIGDRQDVTIPLDKQLPAGPWDAQITMRSGLLERRAEATVTFPKSGEAPSVKTTTSAGRGWLFVVGLGLAVTVLLALAALLLLRRRRQKSLGAPNAP